MAKVFLKFHRTDPASFLCLRFWLEAFKGFDTVILCDLYNPKTEPTPNYLKSILTDYPVTVLNSDYSIGPTYCGNLKGAKHGMASANLTCFQNLGKAKSFWIIDADDTMFLTRDFDLLKQKWQAAEEYLFKNDLHGFSLDFYRNQNNCWTFGVCLLRSDMPWKLISDIPKDEINNSGLARNIDTAFDILRRKGTFKLANFVFDRIAFQHQCNNYPEMPHGIYSWHQGKLWDVPLQPDVISL